MGAPGRDLVCVRAAAAGRRYRTHQLAACVALRGVTADNAEVECDSE